MGWRPVRGQRSNRDAGRRGPVPHQRGAGPIVTWDAATETCRKRPSTPLPGCNLSGGALNRFIPARRWHACSTNFRTTRRRPCSSGTRMTARASHRVSSSRSAIQHGTRRPCRTEASGQSRQCRRRPSASSWAGLWKSNRFVRRVRPLPKERARSCTFNQGCPPVSALRIN